MATKSKPAINYTINRNARDQVERIFVLQQRWVLKGFVESESPTEVVIVDADVIRIWGTTMGLGQIALQGPTSETKLDPCGRVTIPVAALLFTIDCIYKNQK